jgi:UDP:flavonoid glycosyltransferase YjiC (YdhE family)
LADTEIKKVLIAPLDWGLGHATRCIPLIHELNHLGCEVLLGASGQQAKLLQREFSDLPVVPVPDYGIKYSSQKTGFGWKMVAQLPRIRKAIHRERRWLKNLLVHYPLHAVISDNRFGLHHPEIKSVIMTHQLRIRSPFNPFSENLLQKTNYHFIKKFDQCWVVDFEGEDNLAGRLSHPDKMPPVPVRYIGALSRFHYQKNVETKYDLLVLISGPEPQRGHFETLILEQIRGLPIRALVVSGEPGNLYDRTISPTIRQVNHLDSNSLNEVLLQSKLVICRSGYTSVMDMVKLRKKAILVPTPGQTEQEYLAKRLMEKKHFLAISQDELQLKEALKIVYSFPFRFPERTSMDLYRQVVKDFVDSL